MLYLAIDQHRKQLTVNVRDEVGEILVRRQVSTRWKAVEEFFAELEERAAAHGGYMAILEVCGFNDWLLEKLREHNCREIVLVQSEERSKRKTDRRDANTLGELLWVNRARLLAGQPVHRLRRVHIASPQDQEDRQLTALRRNLGVRRTRVINRIKHLLLRHNRLQDCPTKGLQTQRAAKWLAQLALSELDRLEMNHLLSEWKLIETQRMELEARIRARQAPHPTARLVASLPGASAYTSLGLASRIGPIGRFPQPRSLANYWGLTPGCRNSGEAQQRLGSITKQGSAMARFLLGQLVLHVLRKDASMRQWYKRIKQRRGSKIARVAVMRRLCTILWHMLRKQEAYQCGGPPRRRLRSAVVR